MALDRQQMAANLVRLRERKRWTQDKLVDESGVSKRSIQRIERPKPDDFTEIRFSTIEKLANALEVRPEEISGNAALQPDVTDTPDLSAAMQPPTYVDTSVFVNQLDRIERTQAALAVVFEAFALHVGLDLPAEAAAALEYVKREIPARGQAIEQVTSAGATRALEAVAAEHDTALGEIEREAMANGGVLSLEQIRAVVQRH